MSKPGGDPSSGISLGDVLRRPKRHPACRRREAQPGSCSSCTERENLIGDAKGKGASGSNREAESADAPGRGGLLRSSDEAGVMTVERRERAIAIWLGSTGNGRNPMFNGRRQPSCGGTSRMTRECQVRFCEGLGVKFPGPTRQERRFAHPPAISGLPQSPDTPIVRRRSQTCQEETSRGGGLTVRVSRRWKCSATWLPSADRERCNLLKIAGGCTIICLLDGASLRSPREDAGGIQ
jgi:hypothetical protein